MVLMTSKKKKVSIWERETKSITKKIRSRSRHMISSSTGKNRNRSELTGG